MVIAQASKHNLSIIPSVSSSPQITSLLFEPNSLSLSLMHSDSSFSLYPSLSPLSLSSLPSPQTLIPPPSSSSTFLLLQNPNLNPDRKVLFIVSGPHRGGSHILLRFYILESSTNTFKKARVVCTQKDLQYDEKLGVLIDLIHGVSVRVSGSVNYFSVYSVSSSRVLVFAVRMLGDDGSVVKLMRCAVIECCKPIWSISLSFGVLILGEENGVRVFDLRHIGRVGARKLKNLRMSSKPNGAIGGNYRSNVGFTDSNLRRTSEVTCNGNLDFKLEKPSVSVKQKSVKIRQDSSEAGVFFAEFKSNKIEDSKKPIEMKSLKPISIQALSPKKFVILDSAGDLHFMHLSNPVNGSNISCSLQTLPRIMNVQKIAVLLDVTLRTQTIWVSDGYHSVHMIVASDMDNTVSENHGNEIEENQIQISVMQAIFSGEKIQDMISSAANAILILGQEGSLYAYAIS